MSIDAIDTLPAAVPGATTPLVGGLTALPAAAPGWRLATRIAFRFCALYFTLYVAMTQMLPGLLRYPIGGRGVPHLATRWPMRPMNVWVQNAFFGGVRPTIPSGSGDKMVDWVQVLILLIAAALGAALWSILDRRRPNYERLHRWFRIFVRFALGSTMVSYGSAKAIPLQMSAPPLTRLLEPYGNFSPMGALWYSIGASFPYETFTGCVELLAGVLLFIPRTQVLGAAVALAAVVHVFTLNMTYDVPVKLLSFHLVLMSVFLLAPDLKRLSATVFRFGARRRWSAIAQVLYGTYIVALVVTSARQQWYSAGGGAAKPPLYGVWTIDRMTVDGVERAPLVTDYDRWRRVVIQNARANAMFATWRMDDTFALMPAAIDLQKKTITVSQGTGQTAKQVGSFAIDQPAADRLVLDGALNGRAYHMETKLIPREKFLLVSRGFNWVQELPFNR